MREDLIQGAVNFLQDPQVAASSLEKRIAFLQSKNLTAEEVASALQRTGVDPSMIPGFDGAVQSYGGPPIQRMSPQNFGSGYGGGYFPQNALTQQQRAEQQGRDWRDWFVMATVTGTVSYGLYFLAKRYVYPIISPPTPEALTSDKAAIDTAFADAFALLDSLKTDTEALKTAEETRNTRVDQALEEVERVVESLKEASKRREEESKRVNDEVRSLKDLIPKALEGQKESQAASLKDLQSELKSLKALLVNRAGSGGRFTSAPPAAQPAIYQAPSVQTAAPTPVQTPGPVDNSSSSATNGTGSSGQQLGSKPFGSITGGRSAIPAWQLAAQAKAAAANTAAQANAAAATTATSASTTDANGIAAGSANASTDTKAA